MGTTRVWVVAHLFILSLACTGALDVSVSVTPFVAVPVGSDVRPLFSAGGGAVINPRAELLGFLSAGPELGYYITPLLNTGTFPTIVAGGLASGVHFYPRSRLRAGAAVSGGVYEFRHNDQTYSDLWWKVSSDAGFRFSPALTLGVNAGFVRFAAAGEPFYTGILLGGGLHYSFAARSTDGHLTADLQPDQPLFPLLYGVYATNSIGTLTVRNRESAEVRNLSVHFRAENYTAALTAAGSVPLLRRNQAVTFPLFAEFSDRLLDFAEDGIIRGEVVLRYELLGARREAQQTVTIPVHNRNSVRWGDPAVLASFLSPSSPEVLDYAKYIVGLARNHLRTGLNQNMQFAMFLFEGLIAGGVRYSRDDTTPYRVFRNNPEMLDFVQYPFQTLSFRMGDIDDLGLLYAATLESVGIRTALIPLANDFLVAFSLDINPLQAGALFHDTSRLLTADNEIWMPLSMSVMREGFMNSWAAAVGSLSAALAAGEEIEFVVVQEAWKTYPPASIRGQETPFPKPAERIVEQAVQLNLSRYIATEFGPRIRELEQQILTAGGSAALYNRLGLLSVRAGLFDDARRQLAEGVALGSVTAMVNLGNIELLERNYDAAQRWYTAVLERQPGNSAARLGMQRIESRFETRGSP